jgi:PhzF family phenazine biosynthesis protein
VARFFFMVNGGVVEDPATGSACANLGGYLLSSNQPLPIRLTVFQGDAIARPSRLRLHVDEERAIFVSGDVVGIARGQLHL